MSALVSEYEDWEARYNMREALDWIAQQHGLGKYALPEPGQPRKRRVVQKAKVISLDEFRARKALF